MYFVVMLNFDYLQVIKFQTSGLAFYLISLLVKNEHNYQQFAVYEDNYFCIRFAIFPRVTPILSALRSRQKILSFTYCSGPKQLLNIRFS